MMGYLKIYPGFQLLTLFILWHSLLAFISKKEDKPQKLASSTFTNMRATKDTVLKTFLALGDSYTIGESVTRTDTYTNQAVGILKKEGISFSDPLIIAATGWTTLNLKEAINQRRDLQTNYDIVTLLIGVNDQYQGRALTEYKMSFSELLNQGIILAGNRPSHVVVLSIPDYSVTPFGQTSGSASTIARELELFNKANLEIATARL